jgi:hypothetical protein
MFGVEDGFDVVIANPPYVSHVNYAKAEKEYLSRRFETFKERADIYVAFYEEGIQLLKSQGHLTFIAPNKFFRSSYGKALRKYLLKNSRLKTIIDFGDTPIFEATTYPAIIVLEKEVTSKTYSLRVITISTEEQLKNLDVYVDRQSISIGNSDLSEDCWLLERPEVLRLIKKLKNTGILLSKYVNGKIFRGIVTGLNEAFIIDENTKSELISKNAEVSNVIKTFLQGKEIKKWRAKSSSYIIFTNHGVDIKRYPEIIEYLRPFKAKLEQRATSNKHKWYELQQPQTGIYQYFEEDKITWGNLATEPKFAFDETSSYVSAPANIIPTKDLFLLAVLNSPLCKWLISLQAAVRAGGFLEYKPMYVETIPIVQAGDKLKAPIIKLVETILAAPDSPDVTRLEGEINKLLFALYDLTEEEIEIVEGKT